MPTSHVTMNSINFLIKCDYLSFKYLCVVHEGSNGGCTHGSRLLRGSISRCNGCWEVERGSTKIYVSGSLLWGLAYCPIVLNLAGFE